MALKTQESKQGRQTDSSVGTSVRMGGGARPGGARPGGARGAVRCEDLRVLLLEDNPEDARVLFDLLQNRIDQGMVLEHVTTLAAGKDLLRRESFDAVMLDLNLPDSTAKPSIAWLRKNVPQCPVIVFTAIDDDRMVHETFKAGAEDYLTKGEIDYEILTRTLRFSVERHRLRTSLDTTQASLDTAQASLDTTQASLDRTQASLVRTQATLDETHAETDREQARERENLERLARPVQAQATAASYGAKGLEEINAEVWSFLVSQYADLLRDLLEERAYREPKGAKERIRGMAQRLGTLRAEPRDIVKIHLAAIARACEGSNRRRRMAVAEEARLLLVEIMGNLVFYYRTFMGPAPVGPAPLGASTGDPANSINPTPAERRPGP